VHDPQQEGLARIRELHVYPNVGIGHRVFVKRDT
jgi:hypothetical protein